MGEDDGSNTAIFPEHQPVDAGDPVVAVLLSQRTAVIADDPVVVAAWKLQHRVMPCTLRDFRMILKNPAIGTLLLELLQAIRLCCLNQNRSRLTCRV